MKIKRPKNTERIYSQKRVGSKLLLFSKMLAKDLKTMKMEPDRFKEFGMTIFCGRQGDGKSIMMVETLERLRQRYPKALILTNFGYRHQTQPFDSWNDLFEIRNGDNGVIFAIDEIQNEFSSAQSKNFPESLLGELTQQRKQKIKILATSQVYRRVAKPIREQCYEVVEMFTLASRWTFAKCFDANDYNEMIDSSNPNMKFKTRRKWRMNFVQDDEIRDLFDSYAKVERMKKMDYVRESQK